MNHAAVLAIASTIAAPVVAQDRPSVAPKNMQQIAPALAGYTDDILFGDIWVRPGLSPRDRSLVTLSVLISGGKTAQLPGHLGRGLANGVQPAEVAGMVTHLAFYTGWPNAVSALNVIEQVFNARNIAPSILRRPRGPATPARASEVPEARLVGEQVAPIAPKLAELTDGVVFGNLWRRPDLAPRDRSLVTIAALAANGDLDQLAFHLRLGLENGLTRAEIGEALTHLAFYAGWPRATAAVETARKVFVEARATQQASVDPKLEVVPPGRAPRSGPPANFKGSVTVTSPFKGTGAARLGGATVSFGPGARTNWHSHPLGQLLIVTDGRGWVQAEGEPARVVKAGDVVWTGPGVKHWHGATSATTMSHVAVAETFEGSSVTWLEPVTEDQYRPPR